VSDDRARLFVALELPQGVRSAIASWRDDAVSSLDGLRAVPTASLHVTLCFLGWRDASEIDPIAAACALVGGHPAVRLSVSEPLWLPPRRPRVLAVGLDDPAGALSEIQSQLARGLAAGGWYEPESRPFRSHVTLARVGRRERVQPTTLAPVASLPFTGSRVTLYRSHLTPGGAQYEPLATVTLSTARARPDDPRSEPCFPTRCAR
jgi:2'-5' RNA ligase